jgi:allophanate hydrolase subunit 1
MHLAPAGDRAVLVELGDVSAAELHASAASVRALPNVLAVIPGHSSLYVICTSTPDIRMVERRALSPPNGAGGLRARHSTVHVAFNGADLVEFLALTRQTREAFLARVRTLTLTARYLGFRAGFAYLDGWPSEWAMPRRATSRPVSRGSFAIAGAVAGFYPIDSPGGWNLLGRTDANLEHAIAPGDELVIEPVDEVSIAPAEERRSRLSLDYAEVVSAPLVTLVRAPDWSGIERGIPPGGPFDDIAAALANRAVGNAPDAPLLECAMTGPRLRFRRAGFVAWCGRVQRVRAGEEVAFGRVPDGLRGYLAMGGREGVVAELDRGERRVIRAMRGPHDVEIGTIECEVTPAIDRIGIRLRPLRPIDAAIPADLGSCGMQCGTVQLHPDDSLVAMGPDHPVTGGYLQPMTVLWEERWKLAQLVPGERVRFVVSDPSP